ASGYAAGPPADRWCSFFILSQGSSARARFALGSLPPWATTVPRLQRWGMDTDAVRVARKTLTAFFRPNPPLAPTRACARQVPRNPSPPQRMGHPHPRVAQKERRRVGALGHFTRHLVLSVNA